MPKRYSTRNTKDMDILRTIWVDQGMSILTCPYENACSRAPRGGKNGPE